MRGRGSISTVVKPTIFCRELGLLDHMLLAAKEADYTAGPFFPYLDKLLSVQ
jgi:hypothetical protein